MYKESSGTLNLYSSLRDSQTFASKELSDIAAHSVLSSRCISSRYISSQADFRDSQKLQTRKHGQAYTIQILRDLTMGYARRPAAYRAAPGTILATQCNDAKMRIYTALYSLVLYNLNTHVANNNPLI